MEKDKKGNQEILRGNQESKNRETRQEERQDTRQILEKHGRQERKMRELRE